MLMFSDSNCIFVDFGQGRVDVNILRTVTICAFLNPSPQPSPAGRGGQKPQSVPVLGILPRILLSPMLKSIDSDACYLEQSSKLDLNIAELESDNKLPDL